MKLKHPFRWLRFMPNFWHRSVCHTTKLFTSKYPLKFLCCKHLRKPRTAEQNRNASDSNYVKAEAEVTKKLTVDVGSSASAKKKNLEARQANMAVWHKTIIGCNFLFKQSLRNSICPTIASYPSGPA